MAKQTFNIAFSNAHKSIEGELNWFM